MRFRTNYAIYEWFFTNLIFRVERTDFVQIGLFLSFYRGFVTNMIFQVDRTDIVQIGLFSCLT